MKKILFMLCLAFLSWGIHAQHDHANHKQSKEKKMAHQDNLVSFKDAAMTSAYKNYLGLKDALVASNQSKAKKAAESLVESLQETEAGADALEQASMTANAGSLAEQRKAFTTLSDEMTKLVKSNEVATGMLYLEFCPMANDNSGGFWLSNEAEIKNPYFGDRMLKCGKVKETIQ